MIRQDIRRGRILPGALNSHETSRCTPRSCFWLAVGLALTALLFPGCKSTGKAEPPVVMGDVPSGGSSSARWQPTAADFVVPKDAAARASRRRQTRHAVCARDGSASVRAPSAARRTASWKPISIRNSRPGMWRLSMMPSPPRPPPVPIPCGTSSPSFLARRMASSSSPAITTPTCRCPKAYVGANDGGSSTGLLLELADVLRGKQLRRLQRVAGLAGRRRGYRTAGPTPTAFTEAVTWRSSGSRTARQKRLRHFCCSTWWEMPT